MGNQLLITPNDRPAVTGQANPGLPGHTVAARHYRLATSLLPAPSPVLALIVHAVEVTLQHAAPAAPAAQPPAVKTVTARSERVRYAFD